MELPQLLELLKTHRPEILLAYLNAKGDFMEWIENNYEQINKDKETADLQAKVDIGKLASIELAKEVTK